MLVNGKDYKIILRLNEKSIDYFTYVYIDLVANEKHIELCMDNLLFLKNTVERYIINDISLDKEIEEKSLGLLLNKYYFFIEEIETQKDIILDAHGSWIGEKYCFLSERYYATWIY